MKKNVHGFLTVSTCAICENILVLLECDCMTSEKELELRHWFMGRNKKFCKRLWSVLGQTLLMCIRFCSNTAAGIPVFLFIEVRQIQEQ